MGGKHTVLSDDIERSAIRFLGYIEVFRGKTVTTLRGTAVNAPDRPLMHALVVQLVHILMLSCSTMLRPCLIDRKFSPCCR